MVSRENKKFLQNTIRSTDYHNKHVEESVMWRQRDRERNYKPHNTHSHNERRGRRERRSRSPQLRMDQYRGSRPMQSQNHHGGRGSGMNDVMRKARKEGQGAQSQYWQQKLIEAEEKVPGRWGHSGYKKLYIDSSPSSSSRSPSPQQPVKTNEEGRRSLTRSPSSSFSSASGSISPPPGIRNPTKGPKRQEPPVPGLRPQAGTSTSTLVPLTESSKKPMTGYHSKQKSRGRSPHRGSPRSRHSHSPSSYCSTCSFLSSRSRSGSFSSFSSRTPSPELRGFPTVPNQQSTSIEKKLTKNDKVIESSISTTVQRTEQTVRETTKLIKEKSVKKKQKRQKVVEGRPLAPPPPPFPQPPSAASKFDGNSTKKRKKKSPKVEVKLPPPEQKIKEMKLTLPEVESLTSSDSDIEELIVPKQTNIPLSERFGKLAQLSVERQRFGPGSNSRGMQLKVVRNVGNSEKEVYMEPDADQTRRSLSPLNEELTRESLERRVAAIPGYRLGLPQDPRDYAAYADYIERYRHEMSAEEYRQWQTWWLEYQSWLEEYQGTHAFYERERDREWREYRRAWRSDLRVNIRRNKRSMF